MLEGNLGFKGSQNTKHYVIAERVSVKGVSARDASNKAALNGIIVLMVVWRKNGKQMDDFSDLLTAPRSEAR